MSVPTGTTLKAPAEVPLGELRQHPGNPRRISDVRLEHLQRTLTAERGMLGARPLIALPDGTVIAGNQRLAAAVALGWQTIPVVYADLDEEQAARWMLLDNRGFGEDDPELLAAMLRDLDARGADVDLAGYLSADVDAILRAALPVSSRDPDEAPALPAAAKSVRGEVYELGAHRVMCGDATDADDVAALVPTGGASLLWTDPPYGVNYQEGDAEDLRARHRRGDGNATVANDALGDEGTRDLVRASLAAALPYLSPGSSFYVCSPSGISETAFRLALVDVSLELRQVIIWAKDVFAFGRQDYHWRHESILYGWVAGAAHRWNGGREQDTVWEIPRPKRSELHPTMKPVELVTRGLENSSDRDDIVLDPFAGSGSTLIAAEDTGRRCYAMEIEPAYVDVIRQRYADYTDQPDYAP